MYIIYIVPVWNMRRDSILKGLRYREVFNEDSGNKDDVILSLLFKLARLYSSLQCLPQLALNHLNGLMELCRM